MISINQSELSLPEQRGRGVPVDWGEVHCLVTEHVVIDGVILRSQSEVSMSANQRVAHRILVSTSTPVLLGLIGSLNLLSLGWGARGFGPGLDIYQHLPEGSRSPWPPA